MAEACGLNSNGEMKRAKLHFNDNGTIKTADDFNFYINKNGEILSIPQKENLVLNLDALTWCENSLRSASSYIDQEITLSQGGTARSNFGSAVNGIPTADGQFHIDTLNKSWFIPSVARTLINYTQNVLASASFTICLTCKFRGTPTSWRNLTWFNNSDGFRLEWSGSRSIAIYAENSFITQDFSQLSSYTADYFNIIVVVNGTSLKGYQNGVKEIDITLSRNLATANGNQIYIFTQRGTNVNSGFGTGVDVKHFQIWKSALSDAEVTQLRKWLNLA